MEAALQPADRLDEEAILAMQRILVQEQPGSENYTGQYRDSLVWVGTPAPLSAGLLKRTSAYFDSRTSFRDVEAAPLVSCFVEAALFAASSGTKLVNDLHAELAAADGAWGADGTLRVEAEP